MKSLSDLRSAFGQSDRKEANSRPNNYYPFWNMKDDQSCVVRFLPDLDDENPMGFMIEKAMHTLTINGEEKSVPCNRMYDDDCPVCATSSAFYKQDDKVQGKKYWRKKQHLAQAIIVEDPLPANDETGETHEGKVRFLSLGYQLFNIIKDAFESGELDEVPYAFKEGTDFIIKKTKQGDYSVYTVGSKFARKSRDLTEDEIALAQEQMVELKSLLPQQLDGDKLQSMLEASLSGAALADDTPAPAPAATPAATPAPAAAEAETSSDDDTSDEADQILASIRSRRAKKAE